MCTHIWGEVQPQISKPDARARRNGREFDYFFYTHTNTRFLYTFVSGRVCVCFFKKRVFVFVRSCGSIIQSHMT